MRGVIPAGFAAGIDRRNPPRNFQYTNALQASQFQGISITELTFEKTLTLQKSLEMSNLPISAWVHFTDPMLLSSTLSCSDKDHLNKFVLDAARVL